MPVENSLDKKKYEEELKIIDLFSLLDIENKTIKGINRQ